MTTWQIFVMVCCPIWVIGFLFVLAILHGGQMRDIE